MASQRGDRLAIAKLGLDDSRRNFAGLISLRIVETTRDQQQA